MSMEQVRELVSLSRLSSTQVDGRYNAWRKNGSLVGKRVMVVRDGVMVVNSQWTTEYNQGYVFIHCPLELSRRRNSHL